MKIYELDFWVEPFEFYKLFSNKENSFFLDSSLNIYGLGGYSFIGFNPFIVIKSKSKKIQIETNGKIKTIKGNPFSVLKEILNEYRELSIDIELPFRSGVVGYFGYDLCHFIEELPDRSVDDIGLPDCYFSFYDSIFVFDQIKKKIYVTNRNPKDIKKTFCHSDCGKEGPTFKQHLHEFSKNLPYKELIEKFIINFKKDHYINAVIKAKKYIKTGDIFQVNLSQRFLIENQDIQPLKLYSILRKINPAPFASYLNFGNVKILSSSPERFLKVRKKIVETRPMKGTRPRGRNKIEDQKLMNELLNSEKDKAELVMIVDLLRNDLGKVCKFGTVRVKNLRTIEFHPTVFQTTATVSGELKKNAGPVDLLLASFPGGSITGCPKIRAMEIIEELEPTKRNIYTGAIGYIDFSGDMDLSMAIRTIVVYKKKVFFQVGGGIVADSIPEKEYEETLHKGKALMKAISHCLSSNIR